MTQDSVIWRTAEMDLVTGGEDDNPGLKMLEKSETNRVTTVRQAQLGIALETVRSDMEMMTAGDPGEDWSFLTAYRLLMEGHQLTVDWKYNGRPAYAEIAKAVLQAQAAAKAAKMPLA